MVPVVNIFPPNHLEQLFKGEGGEAQRLLMLLRHLKACNRATTGGQGFQGRDLRMQRTRGPEPGRARASR